MCICCRRTDCILTVSAWRVSAAAAYQQGESEFAAMLTNRQLSDLVLSNWKLSDTMSDLSAVV